MWRASRLLPRAHAAQGCVDMAQVEEGTDEVQQIKAETKLK